ncbi:MAG TPA: SGNH/GDSL hydrolase family protein [Flavisolibacter sp.]|jgi:lysophospholipase L1-like esterase|nr:SGNH/GDSL hydrolase family protein [Flavisolibacter sp.]
MKRNRRDFIGIVMRGTLVSAVVPVFFPKALMGCNLTRDMQQSTKGDLKKLRDAIGDREHSLKWIFTGDSITQGAKHTLGYRSYPEIFAERIRFEMGRSRDIVINTAISGHTTREILSDFDWRVGQFKPNVVSLMIGTNDAAKSRHISIEEFEDNLKQLVKKIRSVDAIPLLQTPNIINMGENPEKNERAALPDFAEKMRHVAAATNTILVDHMVYWEERKETVFKEGWLNDPLHPNGKGHLQMARLLFNTLDICDGHSFTCAGEVNFN